MQQLTTGRAGIDAPTALNVLAEFDYDKPKLAADLGVSLRSVQRWAAGRHTPSKRNLTNLRALVGQLLMSQRKDSQIIRLGRAADALLTHQERAEVAEIEARAKAARAEAEQRRAEQSQLQDAIRIATQRRPYRSITHAIDPFALVATGQPAELQTTT